MSKAQLQKLRVAELRERLESVGESSAGKKDELVARLLTHELQQAAQTTAADVAKSLNQLKVPELRQQLKEAGLVTTGKKAELVARLQEHLDSNAASESANASNQAAKPRSEEESNPPAEKPADEASKPADEASKPAEETSKPADEASRIADKSSNPSQPHSAVSGGDAAPQTIPPREATSSLRGKRSRKELEKGAEPAHPPKKRLRQETSEAASDVATVGTPVPATTTPGPSGGVTSHGPATPPTGGPTTPATSSDSLTANVSMSASRPELSSRTVFIRGLVRPLQKRQVVERLRAFGSVDHDAVWLSPTKRVCYATFATKAEADDACRTLHGEKFPVPHGEALQVEFSEKTAMEVRHEEDARQEEESRREEKRTNGAERGKNARQEQSGMAALEQRFHKTRAEPPLFFQPVQEDVARSRLAVLRQQRGMPMGR